MPFVKKHLLWCNSESC